MLSGRSETYVSPPHVWIAEDTGNPLVLSLLGQVLARQSQIHFLQGRSPEGRSTHAEAVEKLSGAVELNPARGADTARLEQIKAGPARLESKSSRRDDNNFMAGATRDDTH